MSELELRRLMLKSVAALPCYVGLTPSGVALAAADTGTENVAWSNWSGIESCKAAKLLAPSSEAQLAAAMSTAQWPVRVFGAGHSFTGLVPTTGTLISLDAMSGIVSHDVTASTVTVKAGTRLAQLSRELDAVGLGLHNLPDIDVQSLAGAMSTATHGTGAQLRALHAEVKSMRVVTSSGKIVEFDESKDRELLQAAQVSLGALGAVSEVCLHVRPAFRLERRVWLLPLEQLLAQAQALAEKHRHFEFYYLPFTGYAAAITHDITTNTTVEHPDGADEDMLRDLKRLRDWLQSMPSVRRWVAQKMIDPNQTMHAVDRSYKLLSTPRPTKFNETECHVPREMGIDCVKAIIQRLEQRNDVYFPLEFRFVKGDDAWLSPFYKRDSVSIAVHALQGEHYEYLVNELAPIFRRYNGRPHWGKLHGHVAQDFSALYPRWKDFLELRKQFDPDGRMLNPHLKRLFGV